MKTPVQTQTANMRQKLPKCQVCGSEFFTIVVRPGERPAGIPTHYLCAGGCGTHYVWDVGTHEWVKQGK